MRQRLKLPTKLHLMFIMWSRSRDTDRYLMSSEMTWSSVPHWYAHWRAVVMNAQWRTTHGIGPTHFSTPSDNGLYLSFLITYEHQIKFISKFQPVSTDIKMILNLSWKKIKTRFLKIYTFCFFFFFFFTVSIIQL